MWINSSAESSEQSRSNAGWRLWPLLVFLGIGSLAQAQDRFTLSGQVRDAATGEDLPFVSVIATNLQGAGTTSNIYGFYSLTLDEGEYLISYQFVGYASEERKVVLDKDQRVDIELGAASLQLEAAEITAEQENENLKRNEGSVTTIDMKDAKKITVFGGEPDIIKLMQFDPGVKQAGEGSSGFYVRGGSVDQNLILLDEAPVYNPSHLLGFFSVFNGDALKGATLYKGGIPAEFGGRTSSVMDIRMKEGNSKKYQLSGGLGVLSGRLTAEGPIVKDKGSFIVSGRRSWADLLTHAYGGDFENTILYFYDFNVKANYRINDNNRILASGYFGRDRLGFNEDFGLDWGNATGTLRWNHIFNDKLFSNTSFIVSDYDYQFSFGVDEDELAVQSVVKNLNLKQDFTYYANENNTMKFGFQVIDHTIEPGNLEAGSNTGIDSRQAEVKHGLELAAYFQNQQDITPRLNANYGLRVSNFNQLGDGTKYTFNEDGELLETEEFDSNERIADYLQLEPRLSLNYAVDEMSALKFGYNRSAQYLHLLTNATAGNPTDTWIMSTNNVKPQLADQVSLGYFRNVYKNTYELSVEGYYKDMQNVIDYRNGADVIFNEEIEGDLLSGDGEAYGVEFLVKKRKGKFTGQLGYTWSRSFRTIDGINDGEKYSARQDRIHDLSLVALYELNERITFSANFIYYTGDAVTYPTGRYTVDGLVVPLYSERNAERMPDYHRLDLGMTLLGKEKEHFQSSWSFGLYNVYARENAFSIEFRTSEDDPAQTEAVQFALFKIVPSITYNFTFK